MNIEEYKSVLKTKVGSKRYEHSLNVSDKARKLAKIHGEDENKAIISGLLHDITKEFSKEEHLELFRQEKVNIDNVYDLDPKVWHGMSGAIYVKNRFNIYDEDMLNAIRYHTIGRKCMSLLEKIVYVSDAISDERAYDGVDEIRIAADNNLDLAMVLILSFTIKKLLDSKKTICRDTFEAYNELIKNII